MNSYNGFTPSQRMKAYKWLMNEYALSTRTKPVKCDSCGLTEGIIEPHSENYGEPFGNHIGQYSFCYRCHMMLHCRFRNKSAFIRYSTEVATGIQYEPFYVRNFHAFIKHLNGEQPVINNEKADTTNVLTNIYARLST
jgi:hypothetical protein